MNKTVLLLQGPVGPFFHNLSSDLQRAGHRVLRINFYGGDIVQYRHPGAVNFSGTPTDWPGFLRNFLRQHDVSTVYLFGAHRPHHESARSICSALKVPVVIFEEGYLRPDWVTADRDGILSESSAPRDPDFYPAYEPPHQLPQERKVGTYWLLGALWHLSYALGGIFLHRHFPHYQHHRPYSWAFGFSWIVKAILYKLRKHNDFLLQQRVMAAYPKRYWFVPLQVKGDAAITFHSPYRQVSDFVADVIISFARHAPGGDHLIIKHHPMDAGLQDYREFIAELGTRYGISQRITYIHHAHLPSLLKNAAGTITINSSLGISSMFHGTPVKALGEAVYDIEGMTFQGPLQAFWKKPGEVNDQLLQKFLAYLRAHSQQIGSFYKRLRLSPLRCGIIPAPDGPLAELLSAPALQSTTASPDLSPDTPQPSPSRDSHS